jgi:hypothetical protein
MNRIRKFIKRSPNGGFFLHIEKDLHLVNLIQKTKLWLSSDYLIQEAIKEDPIKAKETIQSLIDWNNREEKYEECDKLIQMQKKYIKSGHNETKVG